MLKESFSKYIPMPFQSKTSIFKVTNNLNVAIWENPSSDQEYYSKKSILYIYSQDQK